jgi:hypothetical protein
MTPIDGSDHPMIPVAQQILDSLVDIRPEYAGRRVVNVMREDASNTVSLTLDDGAKFQMSGLFARVILAPSAPSRSIALISQ